MSSVWVGMFNVTGPRELAILDGDAEAWLWIAARAPDAAHFVARASHAMNGLGLCVSRLGRRVAMIRRCQISERSAGKFKALLEEFYADSPERLKAVPFGLTLTVKKPGSDSEQD